MQSKWSRRLGLVGLVVMVAWASIGLGCAQERGAINQVQANALSKHFFLGPNLEDDSDNPEFYMRNTVIDVPFGANNGAALGSSNCSPQPCDPGSSSGLFTATYAQPLTRIKWEISETVLIARLTYELVQSSDYHGSRTTDNGQVVAMFNITSQFDIRRSYNPQTGEETNVITENTTDRPWYQREYMRVDWSQNLITDGYAVDTLSMLGIIGGVTWDPETYFIDDPNNPDAPVFNQDEGYFDVTTKAYATPQMVTTPFGTFPACFLPQTYGGTGVGSNCNPTEVTLRLSFRQVVNTDYEPVDWDGNHQYAFGWFTEDRLGYDRNYGIVDQDWHRFAARYNIWQQSHVQGTQCNIDFWRNSSGQIVNYQTDKSGNFLADPTTGLPIPAGAGEQGQPFPGTPVGADPNRDTGGTGTVDDCRFYNSAGVIQNPGSQCDVFTQMCDIPLYSRKLKTIPWYYGPDSDPTLFPATANALGQWNLAVKRAAQIGKNVEATRVGQTTFEIPAAQLTEQYFQQDIANALASHAAPTVPNVFVLCHNPTISGDDPACTPNGTQIYARLGDIRYNLVEILPNPQTGSPWGIMVDADDPLTGEKVVTSVNEWGAVLDIAAQGTEDLIRWINGEISSQQIADGQYLNFWVRASNQDTQQFQGTTLSLKEQQHRLNSIDPKLGMLNGLTKGAFSLPPQVRQLQAAQNLSTNLGPALDTTFEAQRQALIGSSLEAQLVTPNMLLASDQDPKTPLSSTVIAQASPLQGANPGLIAWINNLRDTTMGQNGSCMVEQPEPDSLVGLAREAARLYPLPPDTTSPNYAAQLFDRDTKLHQWIREQFHIAVIAHEMGHSMGLRHNFTGSVDALNYHSEYWQLRSNNNKEHYCGFVSKGFDNDPLNATTPHTNGGDCVGPRWIDPVTDTEVNGLVWKWGSSTVMDYPGDQTQDMNDIGFYDKAAMRFGYSDVVDVDTDTHVNVSCASNAKTCNIDAQTTALGHAADKGSAYLSVLDGFGGIGGETVGGYHYSTYNDNFHILGTCGTQTDPQDPLSATCSGPPLDYRARRDMVDIQKYGQATFNSMKQQWQYSYPDSTALAAVGEAGVLTAHFSVDPKTGMVRHPYMFGSDEYADIGNQAVYRFDAGADEYEQFQFLISTYENRYIFDNFRRGRTTFDTSVQVKRAQSRYFDKIQQMTQGLALLVELDGNPTIDPSQNNPNINNTAPEVVAELNDPGALMPSALAAADGLAMWVRILTRPEPGVYTIQQPGDTGLSLPFAQTSSVNELVGSQYGDFQVALGSGEGRYVENNYDYTQGYYWGDYQSQIGSYYEKVNAIYYLMESYNRFVSNSEMDYIDGRYKNLSYGALYPEQMRRLFAQLMQNDPTTLGPYIIPPPASAAAVGNNTTPVLYLPWEQYDPTDPATMSLEYSQGASVVDPLFAWEEQYPSIFHWFFYAPTSLTTDFLDQARIYSPGAGDTVSYPTNEQIRYLDPIGQIEYAARLYGYETVNSSTVNEKPAQVANTAGARMLQWANSLAAATFVVTGTNPTYPTELVYQLDGSGAPVCLPSIGTVTCVQNTTKLNEFATNIATVRQLTLTLGGPIGHCDSQDQVNCPDPSTP
jgi:hypothetical protein